MTNTRTKQNIAHLPYVPGTSRGPRSLRTLAQQMAKAERERLKEIGARIKELRGRVPQPVIAERVGVTLRAYQAWEAGGGITWENLVKLAEVLGVSEDYIEYGPAGDYKPGTDMARLERKVDALLIHAGIDPAAFDADGVSVIERAASDSTRLLAGEPEAPPEAPSAPARRRRAS